MARYNREETRVVPSSRTETLQRVRRGLERKDINDGWFGTGFDSVSLEQIRQIPGVTGVITPLYDTKPGEVWSGERIRAMKEEVEASGLAVKGIDSDNSHFILLSLTDLLQLL